MRKINARDFQKSFGKITDELRAGQTVQITKHGKVVGRFIKEQKKVNWPEYFSYLEKDSCSVEIGNRMLKEFNDSLS